MHPRAIGFQRWDSLLFLHWRVPAGRLRTKLPPRLTLDTFEGAAYLTMTPFTVTGARVRGVPPLPSLNRFHELNVRTYVTFEGRDPGVWFLSLEAASVPAVLIARAAVGLPYVAARMGRTRDGDAFTYSSERRFRTGTGIFRGSWRALGPAAKARPGTLPHFLAERYFLYARASSGRIRSGEVVHDPWPLRRAEVLRLEESLSRAHGLEPLGAPVLAQYSEGVDVDFLPFRVR